MRCLRGNARRLCQICGSFGLFVIFRRWADRAECFRSLSPWKNEKENTFGDCERAECWRAAISAAHARADAHLHFETNFGAIQCVLSQSQRLKISEIFCQGWLTTRCVSTPVSASKFTLILAKTTRHAHQQHSKNIDTHASPRLP